MCPNAACKKEISGDTYYTEEAIRDVLLNGIADMDIRREALSSEGIQRKTINEIIALVESKEIARNANPIGSINAHSSYKKAANNKNDPPA